MICFTYEHTYMHICMYVCIYMYIYYDIIVFPIVNDLSVHKFLA